MRNLQFIPLNTLSRRNFLKLSAGTVMTGLMASAGSRSSQAKGQLRMMGWADYISPDNISAWEAANSETLVYDSYASNDEMYSKLLLSHGNSGYDIGMNSDFMIRLLIEKGLVEKIDPAQLPNLSNILPSFASPDYDPGYEYTVPKTAGSQGFVYDKSVITRPMETWQDFLDAMANEASGLTSMLDDPLAIAPLFWSKDISWNTKDETVLKDVEGRVEALAKHVKQFNSYPMQDIASGSVVLAQCWNGYAKQAIDSSGNENLVFVYAGPISEIWTDSYILTAGGANREAAHSWMNFVLDPEVAAREITYTGFLTPISGSDKFLAKGLAQDPLIFPPANVLARCERTARNETYDRRIAILTRFKAAAAQ